ncbi:MAG: thiamine pyrophosphate-dependent enzyme [Collimonas pratensis]|uniref:thiamine pyrophosphate-dependent enzyme n=1 Tax=Collimonas pratensis TaxID=279113 RepID=UPI003C73189E
MKSLLKRTVEIDFSHRHRHLPGSLSCLPIIAGIYDGMNPDDVFILSKGHSCAAWYAVLEALGYHPDCSKVHPERDPDNGVTITSGSLGHGLPIAVGIAYAKQLRNERGTVHVLMGDGECQEGTVWESLLMAARLELHANLVVHIDCNGWQGSDVVLVDFQRPLRALWPVRMHFTKKGFGIKRFEEDPQKSTHLLTEQDYNEILEEIA